MKTSKNAYLKAQADVEWAMEQALEQFCVGGIDDEVIAVAGLYLGALRYRQDQAIALRERKGKEC